MLRTSYNARNEKSESGVKLKSAGMGKIQFRIKSGRASFLELTGMENLAGWMGKLYSHFDGYLQF